MERILEVKLDKFEGPLDLLLYLIRKNEIDIYDIPIVKITEEYMQMIEEMKKLHLDVASDYIVMAATLIKIKADMMLPSFFENDEEIEDPRQPLVERLLEYQKIKKATELFRNIELEARKLFGRSITLDMGVQEQEEDLSIVDLMNVFTPILKRGMSLTSYRMPHVKKTIRDKIAELISLLNEKHNLNLNEYMMTVDSIFEAVLTFIAILEMRQKGLIQIHQEEQFADIWVELI